MRRSMSIVVVVAALCGTCFVAASAPVDLERAVSAAAYYLITERLPDLADRPCLMAVAFATLRGDAGDGELLAYVFQLACEQEAEDSFGFLVIAADSEMHPLVAYSAGSAFRHEDVYENILLHLLREDLELRLQAIAEGIAPDRDANLARWEAIDEAYDLQIGAVTQGPPTLSILPAATLALSEATDVDPLLAFATWDQGPPYDAQCPSGCKVGCVATALAQILYHHRRPRAVTFTASDHYVGESGGSVEAPVGTKAFAYPGDPAADPTDAIRSGLSFAAGVSVHTDYGSGASYAYVSDVAVALAGSPQPYDTACRNVWGYASADYRRVSDADRPPYALTMEGFRDLLVGNVLEGLPVLLGLSTGTRTSTDGTARPAEGHAVVCDGLQHAGLGAELFHLNCGWNPHGAEHGLQDAWYNLASGRRPFPYPYTAVVDGVFDIRPSDGSGVDPCAGFALTVTTDKADYRGGEEIVFTITLSEEATITGVDHTPTGRELPFSLGTLPAGTSVLRAVVAPSLGTERMEFRATGADGCLATAEVSFEVRP